MGRIGEISGIGPAVRETFQPITSQARLTEVSMQSPGAVEPDQNSTQQQSRTNERPASPEELKRALDEVNKSIKTMNERLQFRVHEATNVIMVKVVDTYTNEVIKEIPPEKFLDMVAKLQELVGILVDHKI